MIRPEARRPALALAFLLAFTAAQAAPAGPGEVLVDNARALLEILPEDRASYEADRQGVQQRIGAELDSLVDFAGIARGVLGAHGAKLDDAQRARFRRTFRNTLISVYTEALVGFEAERLEVVDTRRRGDRAARVTMAVVTDDGQELDAVYSMARGPAGWQVRNVMIEGINLGLTWRNQFDQLVERHDGDVDAAIAGWERTVAKTAEDVVSASD